MSIMQRDVGPSLVGGWVLPHEGTIYCRSVFDMRANQAVVKFLLNARGSYLLDEIKNCTSVNIFKKCLKKTFPITLLDHITCIVTNQLFTQPFSQSTIL